MNHSKFPIVRAATTLAIAWAVSVTDARTALGARDTVTSSPTYTASDFAKLAEGFDPGIAGACNVQVWDLHSREWKLTEDKGTLTLHLYQKAADKNVPHWQSLGQVNLAKGKSIKVVTVHDTPKPEVKPKETAKSKQKSASKAAAEPKFKTVPPAPALLRFATTTEPSDSFSLDLIRGEVGSIEPSADLRLTQIRTNWQGADFQAPASVEAWQDRAQRVREHLLVTLGLWPMFPKAPLKPSVYGKLERDGYTIEKVVLETIPGFTLSGNLYKPSKYSGRLPAILSPHGHYSEGRMHPDVQKRCIQWAKLGTIVFMYDMVGYNDSKPFPHKFLNDKLELYGLSLPTLCTWNSIRALDWISSLPDVDPARLACTGESGGGTQTFLLTAIDDRIKVAAPVVMVSDTFQGGCVCENCAGLRIGTDNVEFAALTAPRPLVMVGATGDWTARTMERAFPAIRGVYSLVGSPDRVSAKVFDFDHNYNRTTRNEVYSRMSRWLLGITDSDSTQEQEGALKPEKTEDLLTYSPEHPAPANRKTPRELEIYLINQIHRSLDTLSPVMGQARWEASRRFLLTSLKVRVGLVNPVPEQLVAREVRRIAREEFTAVHSVVGRKAAGDAVPVVRLIPAHPSGRLTVLADPRGKAALAGPSGEPSAFAQSLLALGQEVVGFDPIFVGESLDPKNPVTSRPDTVHFDTYNPVTAADQIQDLATVLAWARAQPDIREVSLVAHGTSGIQALVARPALPGLARTLIELPNSPEALTLVLPGLEQFGGLKTAAALSAPDPLWIVGNTGALDTTWPKAAYLLAGTPLNLKIEPAVPSPQKIANWIDRGE